MWAQIIKGRMKPGAEEMLAELRDEMKERISARPGLIQSLWMQNQHDPNEYYTMIIFESEEAARASEPDVNQNPAFQRLREFADGPPEYVDLKVIELFS